MPVDLKSEINPFSFLKLIQYTVIFELFPVRSWDVVDFIILHAVDEQTAGVVRTDYLDVVYNMSLFVLSEHVVTSVCLANPGCYFNLVLYIRTCGKNYQRSHKTMKVNYAHLSYIVEQTALTPLVLLQR